VRTTVTIDDGLLAQAKAEAARSGRTFDKVLEDALRESFGRVKERGRIRAVLPTFNGGGVLPGVDLDNSASLDELMSRHSVCEPL
jgi:hypothetical protein